jgi:hypothetical protein
MMIIMHDAEDYGRLAVNGKPMDERHIARLVGVDVRKYRRLLKELSEKSVGSVGEDGAIYSRRMVRDAAKRESERNRKREQRRNKQGSFEDGAEACPAAVPQLVPPLSHRSSTSTSTSTSTSLYNNTPQPACDVIIPSLKEVEAKAGMIGCNPEWATEFFDYYVTQGWRKANGQPLTNWQTALKRWSDKNREPTAKGKAEAQTAGQSLYLLNGREQGLKSELEELESYCYLEAGGNRSWEKPEQRKRFFELKRELKSIAKEKQNL